MMPSTWSDGDTNRDDQDDCHELSSTHISFLCNQIFPVLEAREAQGKHFHKSPRVWRLLERPGALWAELEESTPTEHSKGRKTAIYAENNLNHFFRSRRTNRPYCIYAIMCAYLWGGNSHFTVQYVCSHILSQNTLSLMHVLPPPLFSPIMHPGAETVHSASTLTSYSLIVKYRPDAYFDHFALYARKQDQKSKWTRSAYSVTYYL